MTLYNNYLLTRPIPLLLFLIILFSSHIHLSVAKEELLLVLEVARHGARAPKHILDLTVGDNFKDPE